MSRLILRQEGQSHFTKKFGRDTESDRVILPSADDCRVKVTRFRPAKGFNMDGIVYSCDETVTVMHGLCLVILPDGSKHPLNAGDVYHVPAGVAYGFQALEDSEVVCVFSAATDGTLPDDE